MARIKLDLNAETFGRLVETAVTERRPVDMQAEVVLMRALGLKPDEEVSITAIQARVAPADTQADEMIGVPA